LHLAQAEHEGRGFCLGNCLACYELLEEMPRSPGAASQRHLDVRFAGPEEILAFLGAPEVCQVEKLFPMSIDRELWSLAALAGGAAQLGFPGAPAAVRSGIGACNAAASAAVDAYRSALRIATDCVGAASASCGEKAAQEALAALGERWRSASGVVARSLAPGRRSRRPAGGFGAPLGNETAVVLDEYALRVWEAFSSAAAPEKSPAAGLEPARGAPGAGRGLGLVGYRRLTDLAIELARNARNLMEQLRLSWGIRNLAGELSVAFPNIMAELPPVAFHTEVYGRHWDVLESLMSTLRAERPDGQGPLRMAELGVACGPIGLHLLLRFPELVYHGADPTIRPEVYDAYRRFGPRASLHAVTSESMHGTLPADEMFDLVFIDGPHTYQNVRNDIELWQPRVRLGGIIAGHDFTCAHPPLLWAVLESRMHGGGAQVNVGTDGVWWWRVL